MSAQSNNLVGLVAGTVERDWKADALQYRDRARTASRKLGGLIDSGVRVVFGDAVAHVLARAHEDLSENSSEEAYAWEQALRAAGARHVDNLEVMQARLSESRVTVARLGVVLRQAFDYETAPRRARRARPPWTALAAAALDELDRADSEPF